MSIVSLPLSNQLTNGAVADGGQVLADLNAIASQVNANAAANGINNDITQLTALIAVPSSITATGWTLYAVTISGGTMTGVAITAIGAVLITPAITGGAATGLALTGATLDATSTGTTAATGDSSTALATNQFVAQTAMNSALPGQNATTKGRGVKSDGAAASWQPFSGDSMYSYSQLGGF